MDSHTINTVPNSTNTSGIEQQIATALDLYTPPLLFCVGITCNTLVMIVMRTGYFRNVSTSLFMCCNALVDNITLLVAFPVHWIHVNFPDLMYRGYGSDIICKVTYFIGVSTSNLGIVLTAAMTIERAIAVQWPLKASHICTKRRAKYVIALLTAFVAMKDSHFAIKSKMVSHSIRAYLCEIEISSVDLRVYVERIYPIMQNVFLLLSFTTIIVSNAIIARQVRKADKALKMSVDSGEQNAFHLRRSSRSRQLTIMLVVDSSTIIVCTTPLAIYDFIKPSYSNAAMGHLVFSIVFYLVYVNRCANLFLYCINGSRFRKSLKYICCKTNFARTDSVYYINHRTNYSNM